MNALADKLQSVFKTLRGYGTLNESNVAEALRDVRMALLAADVNYQVARQFCERVKEKALGEEVRQSIRPGDWFVKIVHDELLALFTREDAGLAPVRPLRVALCGLNGAGKTTTAAKLAQFLVQERERVVLVAADLQRPAAADQLGILGTRIGATVLRPQPGRDLAAHLAWAREESLRLGATVTIFDLAGRMEINDDLLAELASAIRVIEPQESLLVADAALGQAAVEVAKGFMARARLTGLVLSKFDGDARGGSAFSLQEVTGCPIKFLGTGEKTGDFEAFEAERLVRRLLGMGDLYGLAQKVQETVDVEDVSRMQEKMKKESFDLQDFQDQMRMMRKLGPLQNLLGMIPGMGSIPHSAVDENGLKRTEAILGSMTKQERRKPDLINARRRLRIASGSGTSVTEVNQLLHRFRTMKKMMGKVTRSGRPEEQLKKLFRGR
ncbi:MAG: signal recognition particle protein [Candidatus Methylacidiphilales bacterium]|nr:signal recognition particle protein [Candidatus Methylacidiphilales bacterium]